MANCQLTLVQCRKMSQDVVSCNVRSDAWKSHGCQNMSPTAVLTVIKGVTSKRDNCHHGCHPEVSLAVKIGTCERVTDWPTLASTWRHLCQQDCWWLRSPSHYLYTLHCTFRLSQYCPRLTSDLMAKPALAPAQRPLRRNLKVKILWNQNMKQKTKQILLPCHLFLPYLDRSLSVFTRIFSL